MAENTADLVIHGLSSEKDAREIRDALDDVDGVMSMDIDPETGEAEVNYDYDLLSEEEVKRSVRERGFEVE